MLYVVVGDDDPFKEPLHPHSLVAGNRGQKALSMLESTANARKVAIRVGEESRLIRRDDPAHPHSIKSRKKV